MWHLLRSDLIKIKFTMAYATPLFIGCSRLVFNFVFQLVQVQFINSLAIVGCWCFDQNLDNKGQTGSAG